MFPKSSDQNFKFSNLKVTKLKHFQNQKCLELNCPKSKVPKIKYVHNKHFQNIKCPESKISKNKCKKSSAKHTC